MYLEENHVNNHLRIDRNNYGNLRQISPSSLQSLTICLSMKSNSEPKKREGRWAALLELTIEGSTLFIPRRRSDSSPSRLRIGKTKGETIVLLLVLLRRDDSSAADRIAVYWSSERAICERIFLFRTHVPTSMSRL